MAAHIFEVIKPGFGPVFSGVVFQFYAMESVFLENTAA
jgi:hypothetical protein